MSFFKNLLLDLFQSKVLLLPLHEPKSVAIRSNNITERMVQPMHNNGRPLAQIQPLQILIPQLLGHFTILETIRYHIFYWSENPIRHAYIHLTYSKRWRVANWITWYIQVEIFGLLPSNPFFSGCSCHLLHAIELLLGDSSYLLYPSTRKVELLRFKQGLSLEQWNSKFGHC